VNSCPTPTQLDRGCALKASKASVPEELSLGDSPGTVALSNVAVGLLSRREETEEAVRFVANTGSEEQPTAWSSAAVIPKA
jgi:hypothetical protein